MGLGETFKRRWRAAAEKRRRARWYFVCYFAAIGCMVLGAVDGRFFLVGVLGMPYALFGLIYSDATTPKSRGAWYFFLFFGIALFLLLLALNFIDKKGIEIADLVTLAVLTEIALAQIHLLLRARTDYFAANEFCDAASPYRD